MERWKDGIDEIAYKKWDIFNKWRGFVGQIAKKLTVCETVMIFSSFMWAKRLRIGLDWLILFWGISRLT